MAQRGAESTPEGKVTVSVVVPVYNGEAVLVELVDRLDRVLRGSAARASAPWSTSVNVAGALDRRTRKSPCSVASVALSPSRNVRA